jgi:hypothetical protein
MVIVDELTGFPLRDEAGYVLQDERGVLLQDVTVSGQALTEGRVGATGDILYSEDILFPLVVHAQLARAARVVPIVARAKLRLDDAAAPRSLRVPREDVTHLTAVWEGPLALVASSRLGGLRLVA